MAKTARRYTEEEKKYLQKNYNKKSVNEIAEYLGRELQGIYYQAKVLGLKKSIKPNKSKSSEYKLTSIRIKTEDLKLIKKHGGITKVLNKLIDLLKNYGK